MNPVLQRTCTLPFASGLFVCLLLGGHQSPLQAQFLFSDATTTVGIDFIHDGDNVFDGDDELDEPIGTGAAWLDYDLDGDLDLYVTKRLGANLLYRNNGDGTFTDVADAVGAADAAHDGAGVVVADYDNDGDPDLYLANSTEDALLRNNLVETGVATFTDVYAGSGLETSGSRRATSPSWGDYDEDGYLDLYIAHHLPMIGVEGDYQDRFYHNNGDGTFTDVTNLLAGDVDNDGIDDLSGGGFIGAWSDFDKDGDLDILLVNDCPFGPENTKLFRNDGGTDWSTWVFTEVSDLYNADHCQNGMGVAIGDYNLNNFFDYFYTNITEPILLRNRYPNTFAESATAAGVGERFVPGTTLNRVTWGANFFDYDLDGRLDLFVAAGSLKPAWETNPQPNILYNNNGDATFTDVSLISGLNDVKKGRTSVYGDYDQDGDPDLFLVNYGDEAHLYRNDNASGYNWLIVDLVGTVSNRDGIGAQLLLTAPDNRTQLMESHSGTSLGGGDDRGVYFGLLTHTVASSLVITWPSGAVQTLTNIAANQRITVVEENPDASITITGPNGGETFEQGDPLTFTWTDNLAGPVHLQLLKGGTVVTEIVASTLSDGSYDWTLPDSLVSGSDYRLRISSADQPGVADESDADFTIENAPMITVTTPNGGETWTVGQAHAITWTSANITGNVQLRLLQNDVSIKVINSSTTNDGEFTWTVSSDVVPASNYKIRVTSVENTAIKDASNANFTIQADTTPVITVTTPNGGETWTVGQAHAITWTSANITGNVQLRLLQNNVSVRVLSSSTANDGEWTWTIPSDVVPASNYKIRVTSVNNTAIKDASNADFTIQAAAGKSEQLSGTEGVPRTWTLLPNYPNPFNPTTSIRFGMPETARVRLSVYDLLGREVAVLVEGILQAGWHSATWRADNLPSGVYLYRLAAGEFSQHRTMLLLK
jgi:hypothetical protein